jgi:hypothetical protein
VVKAAGEYLLIGGYALAAHGYQRATTDIDVLIRPEDVDRVLAGLLRHRNRHSREFTSYDTVRRRRAAAERYVVARLLGAVNHGRDIAKIYGLPPLRADDQPAHVIRRAEVLPGIHCNLAIPLREFARR